MSDRLAIQWLDREAPDGDPWGESIPLYPVVQGVSCPWCACPLLVCLGWVRDDRKGRVGRRRWWLCPACLRRTVIPIRDGARSVCDYAMIGGQHGEN